MPDTYRRFNPNMNCDDCGVKGTEYMHTGCLVPIGLVGYFCQHCLDVRIRNTSGSVFPLGKTSYIKRCKGKYVLLRFPDVDRPEDVARRVNTMEIASLLAHVIASPVKHRLGRINVCEFKWNECLNDQIIDIHLNELRITYPSVAITGDEVTFIGRR